MRIVITGLICGVVGFVFGYIVRLLCDSFDELSLAVGRLSGTLARVRKRKGFESGSCDTTNR